jgi:CRISPR-associated protein Cmr1
MHELRLTLETVTPLFLGGAEARGQPELRPPAFRGALRYWLRAALGGVIGDQNCDDLRKAESAVFGSTQRGSAITVRLAADNLATRTTPILPHKKAGQRPAFDVGQAITLTLSQVRGENPAIWPAATAALGLMVTLGGVGLRSRRGYGTLRVLNSSDLSAIAPSPETMDGWERYIREVTTGAIKAAKALAESLSLRCVGLPARPAAFPCATRAGHLRLCDLKAPSATDALRHFMEKVPKDKAFGGIQPRVASPLWVRPIRTDKHNYGLLMTVLASKFPGSNYDRIGQFIGQFDGRELRVEGWNA